MKRYQVFISSTFKDLQEERLEIVRTLLKMDCIPSGMEIFPSDSEEQFEVIKKVIDMCDYYVLVVAKRYGSISKITGNSFTEMEFDYAVSKGIPVLAFIANEDVRKESDGNEKRLGDFIAKITNDRIITYWNNKDDLCKELAISLQKEISKNARIGWVKGDEADANVNRIASLISENDELKEAIAKKSSDLVKAQEEITSLTTIEGDLLFDEVDIEVPCKLFSSGDFKNRKVNLRDIFKYISIQFIGVTCIESKVIRFIEESLDVFSVESSFAKRILNQFIALNLMYTKWVDGKGIFYGLTPKGKKLRNELNLFMKQQ